MNAEVKVDKLFRIEKDLLGTREVAQQHYFGIQTLRAVENFQLSNAKVADYANFIKALAMVKQACAVANFKMKHNIKQLYLHVRKSLQVNIMSNFLLICYRAVQEHRPI